mmetsp:Transcript_34166/g.107103  ORF Transcript_34166/g.107103 Transcript_34166/m.107103 type:complete len:138 (+) Transcript_34166:352-765(+)
MLLPWPKAGGRSQVPFPWLRASICVAIFVAYHVPFSILLTGVGAAPGAKAAFADGRFLVMAAWLGTVCAGAYWLSRGSLWVAWCVHWVPVNVWLLFLGGENLLRGGGQVAEDEKSDVYSSSPSTSSSCTVVDSSSEQ